MTIKGFDVDSQAMTLTTQCTAIITLRQKLSFIRVKAVAASTTYSAVKKANAMVHKWVPVRGGLF